jgi:hypothetical protein
VKGIRRGGSKIKNKKLTNGFNVSMVKEKKHKRLAHGAHLSSR